MATPRVQNTHPVGPTSTTGIPTRAMSRPPCWNKQQKQALSAVTPSAFCAIPIRVAMPEMIWTFAAISGFAMTHALPTGR